MDKQKQIEEIEEIARICKKHRHPDGKCLYPDSVDCVKDCKFYHPDIACRWIKTAIAIYKAGYHKIPENAVVLTREEYNELCSSIGISREEVDRVVDMVANDTRKETAKKFAERLKKSETVKEIAENGYIVSYVELCNKIDEIYKEITEGK